LALRLIGVLFISLPILSIFVGTFMDKPIIYSIQTIIYFCVAAQLFRMAKLRASNQV